jgi:predicted Zn-dependent peptidase
MKTLVGALAIGLLLAPGAPASAFELLETRTALKSVHLLRLPESDNVKVQLVVHVGESDLTGSEGLAHYLEHLVHWHTEGGPKPGFSAHRANAYTSNRVTNYWRDTAVGEADRVFATLARVFETPVLPADFVVRERGVVAREYDLRHRENPFARFSERLGKTLYEDGPISRSVIGTPDSIATFTAEDAARAHERFYRPANASLVIAGNIARDQAIALVETHFARFPGGAAPSRAWRSDIPDGIARIRIEHRDRHVRSTAVHLRKIVRLDAPADRARLVRATRLLNRLLASSLPGGLAGPLRFDQALADDHMIDLRVLTDSALEVSFWARPAAGIAPERAVATFEEALARLAATGLDPDSVRRVVERACKAIMRDRENIDQLSDNAAEWLLHDVAPVAAEADLEGVRSVTKAGLDRLVHALAQPGRTVVGLLRPEESRSYEHPSATPERGDPS